MSYLHEMPTDSLFNLCGRSNFKIEIQSEISFFILDLINWFKRLHELLAFQQIDYIIALIDLRL